MDIEAFAAESGINSPHLLSELAIFAYKRYMQTESLDDISNAIYLAKRGIDLVNEGNLLLTQWLSTLGFFSRRGMNR